MASPIQREIWCEVADNALLNWQGCEATKYLIELEEESERGYPERTRHSRGTNT